MSQTPALSLPPFSPLQLKATLSVQLIKLKRKQPNQCDSAPASDLTTKPVGSTFKYSQNEIRSLHRRPHMPCCRPLACLAASTLGLIRQQGRAGKSQNRQPTCLDSKPAQSLTSCVARFLITSPCFCFLIWKMGTIIDYLIGLL